MSYGICRVQKVKAAAVGAMQYHNDRMPGRHSNEDIDPSRTHLNWELTPHRDYESEVAERIERGRRSGRKLRKDAVVLVEGIMTASPEFFRGKSDDDVRRWALDCCRFAESEFGRENIVHFTLHVDEETPHIHFGFVPLKDGTLAWKNFFPSKVAMSKFQDRFYEQVSERWGLERGEKRRPGENARRHKSVREQKAATIRALNAEAEERSERVHRLAEEQADLAPKVAAERAALEAARAERERVEAETARELADAARERDRMRAEAEEARRRLESVQGEAVELESFEKKGLGELAALATVRGIGERERAAEAAVGRERERAGRLAVALADARRGLRDLARRVTALVGHATDAVRVALRLPERGAPARHFEYERLWRNRDGEVRETPERGTPLSSQDLIASLDSILGEAETDSRALNDMMPGRTVARSKSWQR